MIHLTKSSLTPSPRIEYLGVILYTRINRVLPCLEMLCQDPLAQGFRTAGMRQCSHLSAASRNVKFVAGSYPLGEILGTDLPTPAFSVPGSDSQQETPASAGIPTSAAQLAVMAFKQAPELWIPSPRHAVNSDLLRCQPPGMGNAPPALCSRRLLVDLGSIHFLELWIIF